MGSFRSTLAGGLLALTVAACAPAPSPPKEQAAPVAPAGGPAQPTPAAKAEALPFIENDYAAALAKAKEAKLPLFIDVWAPW